MRADEFIQKLTGSDSSIDELVNQDFPSHAALKLRDFYFVPNKQEKIYHENALIELALSYDLSSLEIGTIGFHYEPFENEKYSYWEFGFNEADPLVIDKETGRILLLDHSVEYFVMAECAENSEKFLDALLEVATTLANGGFNKEGSCEKAKQSANLAGGEKYLAFYQTLLGCYE